MQAFQLRDSCVGASGWLTPRTSSYPTSSIYTSGAPISFRFPYTVVESGAGANESMYPVFNTQATGIRDYTVAQSSYPTGPYPSYYTFYTFTYTLPWTSTGPNPLARDEISILD